MAPTSTRKKNKSELDQLNELSFATAGSDLGGRTPRSARSNSALSSTSTTPKHPAPRPTPTPTSSTASGIKKKEDAKKVALSGSSTSNTSVASIRNKVAAGAGPTTPAPSSSKLGQARPPLTALNSTTPKPKAIPSASTSTKKPSGSTFALPPLPPVPTSTQKITRTTANENDATPRPRPPPAIVTRLSTLPPIPDYSRKPKIIDEESFQFWTSKTCPCGEHWSDDPLDRLAHLYSCPTNIQTGPMGVIGFVFEIEMSKETKIEVQRRREILRDSKSTVNGMGAAAGRTPRTVRFDPTESQTHLYETATEGTPSPTPKRTSSPLWCDGNESEDSDESFEEEVSLTNDDILKNLAFTTSSRLLEDESLPKGADEPDSWEPEEPVPSGSGRRLPDPNSPSRTLTGDSMLTKRPGKERDQEFTFTLPQSPPQFTFTGNRTSRGQFTGDSTSTGGSGSTASSSSTACIPFKAIEDESAPWKAEEDDSCVPMKTSNARERDPSSPPSISTATDSGVPFKVVEQESAPFKVEEEESDLPIETLHREAPIPKLSSSPSSSSASIDRADDDKTTVGNPGGKAGRRLGRSRTLSSTAGESSGKSSKKIEVASE